MSLIDASELPDLAGEDQTDQIRRELYSRIIQDLTESRMDLAVNYSVIGKTDSADPFPTPMDWITDQANKALAAFDMQFGAPADVEPIQTADKAP